MNRKQRQAPRHRKSRKPESSKTRAVLLRQALEWFPCGCDFTGIKLHGNAGWVPVELIALAVLWSWSDQAKLTGAFDDARQLATEMFGTVAVTTYQGLMGALRSHTEQLLPVIWSHLQLLMQNVGGKHWRIGIWLPLAVDGSRVTTPRTASNEKAFAAANYGHGKRAKSRTKWKNKKRRSKRLSEPVKPQIWLTLVWHMGLKLPWCWRTGPSTSSERHHLMELLKMLVFPINTLFAGTRALSAMSFGKRFWTKGTASSFGSGAMFAS